MALIGAFRVEYEGWKLYDHQIEYLKRLHRARFKALRLIGQAYLHIAFDLPRVIAVTLTSPSDYTPHRPVDEEALLDIVQSLCCPRDPIFLEQLASTIQFREVARNRLGSVQLAPSAVEAVEIPDINRARALFLAAAPSFFTTLEECGVQWSQMGVFSPISRVLPDSLSITRALGHWILALRAHAWIQAEILATTGLENRAVLEDKLLDGIVDASRKVLSKWSPIYWIGALLPPSIALAVTLVTNLGRATQIVLLLMLALLAYLGLAYWDMLRITNILGREIMRRSGNVFTSFAERELAGNRE